jgi:hypothetical protein
MTLTRTIRRREQRKRRSTRRANPPRSPFITPRWLTAEVIRVQLLSPSVFDKMLTRYP